jgi:tRNA G18 (ribose-2'-O)-methylase SpoU
VESAVFYKRFATKALNAILLVFGNEVHGVTEAVALCDGCIEMQLGTKHSLNISVSAGIVVWDLFQKINWSK